MSICLRLMSRLLRDMTVVRSRLAMAMAKFCWSGSENILVF